MRVVLSTYGSRGDVEPPAGLAVRLRGLGAEVESETRARATTVAGTNRAGGATASAKLLLDAIGQERPPMPA
ncbi:hypothetical protein ADL29_27520 [Streptomyces chattanoogensis]|uniref:Glycosyl transferase n=1 Tax=Streptomyces chattanoogensis TaxID=66876 RepID=A0A0N0XT07_9ACTN|nr:hypothetical protein ADL29_27520 [Streptomyces chattanoogensis]